jgi:hypothetical protein
LIFLVFLFSPEFISSNQIFTVRRIREDDSWLYGFYESVLDHLKGALTLILPTFLSLLKA